MLAWPINKIYILISLFFDYRATRQLQCMLAINPRENCRMLSPGEMGVCGLPKTDRHSQKPWIDRTFAHNFTKPPPYHNLCHSEVEYTTVRLICLSRNPGGRQYYMAYRFAIIYLNITSLSLSLSNVPRRGIYIIGTFLGTAQMIISLS